MASHQLWARQGSDSTEVAESITIRKRPLKGCFDVVVAVALLVVLSPLMVGIALLVRTTSKGPAFFRQTRLGRDERPFVMLKFRTMRNGSDDSVHREYVTSLLTAHSNEGRAQSGKAGTNTLAQANGLYKLADPRVTRLGKWLRRTSLDELPQLVNVVCRHMSLVGPRPVLPFEAALFRGDERLRFAVRPGLTGLWQVSGRSRIGFRDQLTLDTRYVREQSLRLDTRILLLTIPSLLSGGTS